MSQENWSSKLTSWAFKKTVSGDYPGDEDYLSLEQFLDTYYLIDENPNLFSEKRKIDDIKDWIGSDCRGLEKITTDGKSIPLVNAYTLYETIGKCFNVNHENYIPDSQYEAEQRLRDEILDDITNFLNDFFEEGESLKIHMFSEGNDKWSLLITKVDGNWNYVDF